MKTILVSLDHNLVSLRGDNTLYLFGSNFSMFVLREILKGCRDTYSIAKKYYHDQVTQLDFGQVDRFRREIYMIPKEARLGISTKLIDKNDAIYEIVLSNPISIMEEVERIFLMKSPNILKKVVSCTGKITETFR